MADPIPVGQFIALISIISFLVACLCVIEEVVFDRTDNEDET